MSLNSVSRTLNRPLIFRRSYANFSAVVLTVIHPINGGSMNIFAKRRRVYTDNIQFTSDCSSLFIFKLQFETDKPGRHNLENTLHEDHGDSKDLEVTDE